MEATLTKNGKPTSPPNVHHMVDIVIPTYDNYRLVGQAVASLYENTHPHNFNVIVVNNGIPGACNGLKNMPGLSVYDMGKNTGWEGGINFGLDKVDAPLTLLMNDDIHIVPNDPSWLLKMASTFKDPTVGAVGPCSNYVMQKQNLFWMGLPRFADVSVLVGFCMMVRTQLLRDFGGLTANLPGGDDLDLSMKITSAGYKLRLRRDVFVYHHGAVTGRRVHGNYWDSEDHQDKTNCELIRRHGFINFFNCRQGIIQDVTAQPWNGLKEDAEGIRIRELMTGNVIYDFGCGPKKTTPEAIGVDLLPKGEDTNKVNACDGNLKSAADIQGNVETIELKEGSADTIVARHILEHILDTVSSLRRWISFLKPGGRLILAVPDETIVRGIPLNPEHVHAFTEQSLSELVKAVAGEVGTVRTEKINNNMSFILIYDKN